MDLIGALLSRDFYLPLNKKLLEKLGGDFDQTALLTELITLDNAFKNTDQMKFNNNWFFRSVEDIQKSILMNDYRQRSAIEKLVEKGLVEVKRAGRPARRFFRLDKKAIFILLAPEEEYPPEFEDLAADTKKEKQAAFYEKLNSSTAEGFDSFKKAIDNIPRDFAAFMYTWSALILKTTPFKWSWTPEGFGKLRNWFRKSCTYSDLDYSILNQFFNDHFGMLKPETVIQEWVMWYSLQPDKSPSERCYDPRPYWN